MLRRDPKPQIPQEDLKLVDGILYRRYDALHPEYDALSSIYEVNTQPGRSFITTPEAHIHDQRCLPHQYPDSERRRMFPRVEVPEEEYLEDWNPPCGGRTWVAYEGYKVSGCSDRFAELQCPDEAHGVHVRGESVTALRSGTRGRQRSRGSRATT